MKIKNHESTPKDNHFQYKFLILNWMDNENQKLKRKDNH